MKITLIADIHGNLPALEAVLRHARAQDAARMILNLGDLTGYGPFPEEVTRWSRSPEVISVLGDYDRKVLSKKQRRSGWSGVKTAHKREMFAWTNHALSKQSRQYLRSLPETREITVEGVQIFLSHGSPAGPQEYIGPDTPRERLEELAALTDARVLLFGHTHQAFSCQVEGVSFINPGTVGRPDDGDPRASYAVLEIEGDRLAVHHFRVPYNIMATVSGLRRAGLPEVFTRVIRWGLNYDDAIAAHHPTQVGLALEPSGVVSLLTDFGLQDPFVGVMKGVIAGIAPQVTLVDVSHQVQPQDIAEAARLLAQAVSYFPPGTVHLAVVDPGVGTERRAMAAQIGDQFFVAPDNGLLTPILENARNTGQFIKVISLSKPAFWLPQVSNVFHGRDIFAPIAAHLANGIPLLTLGDEIDDPVLLALPQPEITATGWQASVVLIDRFGNLITNLPGDSLLTGQDAITIIVGDAIIQGLSQTFGAGSTGTLIALIDSSGFLSVAEVNGDAAARLGVGIGDPVEIRTE